MALDAPLASMYSEVMPLVFELLTWVPVKLPIASLFPTFLYLCSPERLKEMLDRILELLKSGVDKEQTVLDLSRPSDPFQKHLETLLYADQELNRLRMKLSVADFCWVRPIRSGGGGVYQALRLEMLERC